SSRLTIKEMKFASHTPSPDLARIAPFWYWRGLFVSTTFETTIGPAERKRHEPDRCSRRGSHYHVPITVAPARMAILADPSVVEKTASALAADAAFPARKPPARRRP